MNQKQPTAHVEKKRISSFEPQTLALGVVLAIFAAAICMQIIGRIGTTPNTSLIGAIFAMIFARIPLEIMRSFRSLQRQNYIQTIVSGAGFAASNCAFVAIAIVFIMGRTDLIVPMAFGTMFGSVVSVFVIGRIFDSSIFPAQAAWPPGVATASTIQAGDEGGEKGRRLLQGLALGILGSYFKLPIAGIGIVFIANILSMAGLGIGLILRGYSPQIFGFSLGQSNIPQGVMIGAGLMALLQCVVSVYKNSKNENNKDFTLSVPDSILPKILSSTFLVHVAGAILAAVLTGIFADMGNLQIIAWVIWTALAATMSMLLVGMAAMRSGWFPGFAITTIFMSFAVLMGFPPLAIAIMTGYLSSTGPTFADMGFDLKTGWILRGSGSDPAHELYGRKQQVNIEALGVIIGVGVVIIFGNMFLAENIYPPISKAFSTAINAGSNPALVKELALWALPGMLIQLAFGNKMVGVLFATGLILNNPLYGIGVLGAVVARCIFGTKFMDVRAAGLITGDGIFGFLSSVFRTFL